MVSFPPPSRPPTSGPLDPWDEQRRRDENHRRERRRRRRRRLVATLAVLAVLASAGALAGLLLAGDRRDPGGDAVDMTARPTAVASSLAPEASSTVTAPGSTVSPADLVAVDEVWLLDRGDGVYDWGLTVFVPDGAPTRSGVEVSIRLVDADGGVVQLIERTIDGVDDTRPSTAAGRLVDPPTPPTRLEFDVAVGTESDDLGLDALLSARAVERDGDELVGRIRSSSATDIEGISMVLVWREETTGSARRGDVAAVVVYDIERLRVGVDARFDIDLSDQAVPAGVPDDIFWAPSDSAVD